MEYKALSQATYKFTTEVTINCNPLEDFFTPKFGCIKYTNEKTNAICYGIPLQRDTSTSYTSSNIDFSYSTSPFTFKPDFAICSVDGIEYIGTKYAYFYFAYTYSQPIHIKGKFTVIKYNSTSKTIETNLYDIDKSVGSENNSYFYFMVPKLSNDLILGIIFEPA